MHTMDQDKFGFQVMSLDVEDVKTTFYDTLRMAGKLHIRSKDAVLWTDVYRDVIHGYQKDYWRQVPRKIMFDNRISWACMISLDFKRNRSGENICWRR